MRKNFWKPHLINCGRCGHQGMAKRNWVHGFLVAAMIFAGLIQAAVFTAGFYDFSFDWMIADGALIALGNFIIHDERALLCPRCENVNYDRIRD